ncbi:MAG: hypothetical protein K2X93_14595 [Candidatus Obscuribacterales bacterium]|nr:hypothetical protein [Candidatus Obscuribacterales bacterium]
MPKKGEIDLRKLKYWSAVMADFEKSGQSGQAYCKVNVQKVAWIIAYRCK